LSLVSILFRYVYTELVYTLHCGGHKPLTSDSVAGKAVQTFDKVQREEAGNLQHNDARKHLTAAAFGVQDRDG